MVTIKECIHQLPKLKKMSFIRTSLHQFVSQLTALIEPAFYMTIYNLKTIKVYVRNEIMSKHCEGINVSGIYNYVTVITLSNDKDVYESFESRCVPVHPNQNMDRKDYRNYIIMMSFMTLYDLCDAIVRQHTDEILKIHRHSPFDASERRHQTIRVDEEGLSGLLPFIKSCILKVSTYGLIPDSSIVEIF